MIALSKSKTLHSEAVILTLITIAALCLRFYRLGDPSLWIDEFLVVLAADKPLPYLFNWLNLELHPPSLYLLVKSLFYLGSSDFALRCLFALLGAACVPLAYAMGKKLQGGGYGLLLSALVAICLPFVIISREVRPYAFVIFFSILSLRFCAAFMASNRKKDIYLLVASNTLLMYFHYLSCLFAFSFLVAMLAARGRSGRAISFGNIARYCIWTLLSIVPLFFFIFHQAHAWAQGTGTSAADPRVILEYLRALESFPRGIAHGALTAILWFFAAAGIISLFFSNRNLLIILCAIIATPCAILTLFKINLGLSYYHILPAGLALLMLIAEGASRLARVALLKQAAALLILIAGVTSLAQSYSFDFNYPYKSIARALPAKLQGSSYALIDTMAFYPVNWYLDRFLADNPVRGASLAQADEEVSLHFVSGKGGGLPFYGKPEDLVHLFGLRTEASEGDHYSVISCRLKRTPVTRVSTLPYSISRSARPLDLYKNAAFFENTVILPNHEGIASPGSNNVPSRVGYLFENHAQNTKTFFNLLLKFKNSNPGGSFKVKIVFDDEPEQVVFSSIGPAKEPPNEGLAMETVAFGRIAPYRKALLIFESVCPLITPEYWGGNLETTGLVAFRLEAEHLATDFLAGTPNLPGLVAEGLKDIEVDGGNRWRWALGSETRLIFNLAQDSPVTLFFSLFNPLPGQKIRIEANGESLGELDNLPADSWLIPGTVFQRAFPGRAGKNIMRFRFEKWNGNPALFAANDPQPYAAAFTALRLDFP